MDRLTDSTRHLTDQLRHLEDSLRARIEAAEDRLQKTVQEAELTGRARLDRAEHDLTSRIAAFEQTLDNNRQRQQSYLVKTDENTGRVASLVTYFYVQPSVSEIGWLLEFYILTTSKVISGL